MHGWQFNILYQLYARESKSFSKIIYILQSYKKKYRKKYYSTQNKRLKTKLCKNHKKNTIEIRLNISYRIKLPIKNCAESHLRKKCSILKFDPREQSVTQTCLLRHHNLSRTTNVILSAEPLSLVRAGRGASLTICLQYCLQLTANKRVPRLSTAITIEFNCLRDTKEWWKF